MDNGTLLIDRLRVETQSRYHAIESLPFFKALAAGALPLHSYVALLNALNSVYAVLEHAASTATHPALVAVWHDAMRKQPLLQRDLAAFGGCDLPELPVTTLYALLLAEQIRHSASDVPVALLGYLYVFAGSTLGSIVPRSQVAQAFTFKDRAGLGYLSSYEPQVEATRQVFDLRMRQAPLSVSEHDCVVAAAEHAMLGLETIVASLYPVPEQELAAMVAALNPEAGHHAIADDPREIAAALRAGDISWRQVPYYAWRYGERGRRFTWSDSAWIVTLAAHAAAVATHQLDWLSRVLAARGMPRWLLEQHLQVLHDELVRAIPEQGYHYAPLAYQSARLRELRHQQLDETTFQTLAAEFDRRVGAEWAARFAGTGYLLVAAVADERAGIKQAVRSIEGALTDPAQFPQPWIEAVHDAIEQARKQAVSTHARSSAQAVSATNHCFVAQRDIDDAF